MGIRGRLVASHFALVLTVVLLVGLVSLGLVRGFILRSAQETLRVQAAQIGEVIDGLPLADGRLGGGLAPVALVRLVSRLTSADFLLIGPDGQVVRGSDRLAGVAGVMLPDPARRALAAGSVSSTTWRDPLGRLSVVAVAPLVRGGEPSGAVVLFRPVTEVSQTTGRVLSLFLWASLVGLALSLVMSWVLARNLTRPMRELEAAAGRVAAGDFGQRVPVRGDDELARVARSFNDMAARLGELKRERQELYASVSHELRTPVTSIRGFAQALAEGVGSPAERSRHLHIIQEESTRLERLVNDLFQLARLEAGQVTFEWRPVDLAAVVAQVAEKFRTQAEPNRVTLDFLSPPPDRPLIVRADPDRLEQVLGNLVQNALRFTPSGGRVVIRAEAGDHEARVSVADTGPGIPDADLELIFDRFYTVDRSRARSKAGTGLGLAIAREIVQAHGGRIWAGRAEEGGALLTFTVPLAADQPPTRGG